MKMGVGWGGVGGGGWRGGGGGGVNEITPIKPSSMMTSIVPHNLDEAYRLAKAVALSGLAPKDMKQPEQILVAILHGLEIGLKPMMALQRIAVINGRPTIWGDAAIGLVRASGLLESIKEGVEGQGDGRVAYCNAKRRGDPESIYRTFSVENAKVAGLWKKSGPWTTHPDRMLSMRARGFCLRDGFADVLGGMYLAEELQGEAIDVTPTIPTPPTPPKIDREEINVPPIPIPADALKDFDAFHKALDSCPTIDALNAMFEALTKNMSVPDDLEEAQARFREVAAKFGDAAGMIAPFPHPHRLDNGASAIKWIRGAPAGTRLTFQESKRTLPQNSRGAGQCLPRLPTQATHCGCKYPARMTSENPTYSSRARPRDQIHSGAGPERHSFLDRVNRRRRFSASLAADLDGIDRGGLGR